MSTNKIQFFINYHYIDISVIIPVYNSQKTITKSIISIQNQKKPTYEIILINDCSSDNSKRIIENLKIKDSRIKIINNRKNMGTLYSRCIGVLFSKGKYIFPLDNDDMFLENIFWSIYKEAYNNDYDIVGFKALRGNSYYSQIKEMYDDPLHMHRNGLIVYQPELSHFSLLNKECHIWGKSIKAKIYKKAINILGKKKYSIYVSLLEDNIMVFILFQFANSFKFISKYGIYHLIHQESASFTLTKDHYIFCYIYFLEIIFDFTKNNYEDKKYVILIAIQLEKSISSRKLLSTKNRKYLKKVLEKIINSKYIINDDKIRIKKEFPYL